MSEHDFVIQGSLSTNISSVLPLTPEQFIKKIIELRPLVLAQQERADILGGYTGEVHEALLSFGAYGVLQPRKYGGHEFDISTFFKAVIEIARSDPGSAWCYCFPAAHALVLSAHFEQKAQEELFGANGGVAIGPLRHPTPTASIRKVEGGYIVDGTWDYGSGIPHANYVMVAARLIDEVAHGLPSIYLAVVPKGRVHVVEGSWGNDSMLGLRASGSYTFVIKDVFVPDYMVVPFDRLMYAGEDSQGTPGTRLHGNSMYIGLTGALFSGIISCCMIGAAWAMLDEFEAIGDKRTINPPFQERYKSAEYQRAFGTALLSTRAAEILILDVGKSYMEYSDRWKEGTAYTAREDFTLGGMAIRAAQLAAESVERLFYSGGSSGAKRDSRLNRYFRDMATYRTHPIAQFDTAYEAVAQAHFNLPVPILGAWKPK